MEKSNIIISIIVVICIAAGVAAYGITNSENPVFSNLHGIDSGSGDSGNGIGNNTTHHNSQSTNSHGSGNGGTGTGSGSGVSSGSGSGSGSGHGNGGGSSKNPSPNPSPSPKPSPSPSPSPIPSSQAKSIASGCIGVSGWYAGEPSLSGRYYYVPIYDQDNSVVDSIQIDAYTGDIIGRG
ncbi:endoglucanase [uncultured Methanobrevibacter sp.]|uniref:endoglucanase n=1 Tax=uncultured Methanobrevibacter sp. TaxID=253161 RepID=UPI002636FE08|nr:endoglucanase [uncultured Methanobrevibacter sp.]